MIIINKFNKYAKLVKVTIILKQPATKFILIKEDHIKESAVPKSGDKKEHFKIGENITLIHYTIKRLSFKLKFYILINIKV